MDSLELFKPNDNFQKVNPLQPTTSYILNNSSNVVNFARLVPHSMLSSGTEYAKKIVEEKEKKVLEVFFKKKFYFQESHDVKFGLITKII